MSSSTTSSGVSVEYLLKNLEIIKREDVASAPQIQQMINQIKDGTISQEQTVYLVNYITNWIHTRAAAHAQPSGTSSTPTSTSASPAPPQASTAQQQPAPQTATSTAYASTSMPAASTTYASAPAAQTTYSSTPAPQQAYASTTGAQTTYTSTPTAYPSATSTMYPTASTSTQPTYASTSTTYATTSTPTAYATTAYTSTPATYAADSNSQWRGYASTARTATTAVATPTVSTQQAATTSAGTTAAAPAQPDDPRRKAFKSAAASEDARRAIRDLVTSVDPKACLDKSVEDLLLDIADDFVDSVTNFSCRLARHRGSESLDVKDLQLHLERNHNIRIPGFASDDTRTMFASGSSGTQAALAQQSAAAPGKALTTAAAAATGKKGMPGTHGVRTQRLAQVQLAKRDARLM